MIREQHKAFAKAVVKLARQHGMNNINMTFNASGLSNHLEDWKNVQEGNTPERVWDHVVVTMNWSENRHGARSNISLAGEMREVIEEDWPTP